jgi:7-cyano-7-deazaguanine reductase
MASVHSDNNPLGQVSAYRDTYDPSVLFPIERDESWRAQGLCRDQCPFFEV